MGNGKQRGHTVLVVDDDLHILEVIDARLSAAGYRVITAPSAREALESLRGCEMDLLISDIRMPGMGGMELLSEARLLCPEIPVILLTAYGTIPDAVTAIKAGAVEYLTKPFDGRELLRKIETTLQEKPPRPVPSRPFAPGQELWGTKSPAMRDLLGLMDRVRRSDVTVLILGESGVGKELVARLIHKGDP
jgi:DNA-binding NtrC family response regulator